MDARSFRAPITNHFVIPSNTGTIVQNSPIHDAWFIRHLRCTRGTYQRICQNVEVAWQRVHPPLHHHNTMSVNDGVACTLHYLAHSDGYESTAALFGISKTRAYEYCNQVTLVIQLCYVLETIVLPSSRDEWEVVRVGFEEHGFPNAYGAIDGSLIQVKRFEDFYGWYCRKGFPAFNMQAVVDHRMRFMSYSLRSGSQNDKAMFNESLFGQTCHTRVPPGGCFVGDAGYKLFTHVMTPYSIVSSMAPDEANYNWIHSRSRMVVERAFGRWKNKFRMFKHELLHHCPRDMARLIEVTLVLHNWYIDYDNEAVMMTSYSK
ncbi:hypothetical protein H257_14762 [Aphanomyces astaci]|uniref:DDE Tnp4 domain-containing protein n=1 Tax=Aphanomyces astaci TaxID=112090 RepID=W4FRD8_APHAT|nr:hypothetical protein H257_14762 [Aphanomyces astaci]ETV69526.1 hypothetical protein H257_14762 [Aphanomyces astaci]|eukprot:XP_009840950.1 hypothetical protein H257_14762 [Aphanomyces astaci]